MGNRPALEAQGHRLKPGVGFKSLTRRHMEDEPVGMLGRSAKPCVPKGMRIMLSVFRQKSNGR